MDSGTDMSGMTEMGGSTMGGSMKPWLHFTLGDSLFFMAWVPMSAGAVVGACIGLFILAIIERWVTAMRDVMQVYWAQKSDELVAARFNLSNVKPAPSDEKRLDDNTQLSEIESLPAQRSTLRPLGRIRDLRRTAPFIPAHDFARGAIHVCRATIAYTLMLAIMTFHAGYIIAIILGLGAGEVLFGRFGAHAIH